LTEPTLSLCHKRSEDERNSPGEEIQTPRSSNISKRKYRGNILRMKPTALILHCFFACFYTASAQRSVWDIILGISRDFESSENAVETNVQPALFKTSLKAAHSSGVVFKTSEETTTTRPSSSGSTTTSTTPSTTSRGKRKIIVNLMDVYHCPKPGAYPIDGDCSRFLLCRQGRQGRQLGNKQMRQGRLFGKRPPIRGKVYKCPEGYLFSNAKARCKPESKVACHRSNPLHRLRQAYDKNFFLMP